MTDEGLYSTVAGRGISGQGERGSLGSAIKEEEEGCFFWISLERESPSAEDCLGRSYRRMD